MKKLAVTGAVVLVALIAAAWVKGGSQQMHWIEQPVTHGATQGEPK
ncbi:MAG: hypothetical protein VW935_16010 [Novosphingobium sp.]|jgi:hypothetical protein